MAAIYSGIHLKLKSPQTPWEDKLKLARFAWISSHCLLPNKEQVLLDWCTHALTGWYSQKVEFSHSVLEGLWCYIDDMLHSQKLHSLSKQGKSISLRLSMAQLLLDCIQECAHGSMSLVCGPTILSVCEGILSSPVLSTVFTTKYELMADLLAKLCSLTCCHLQQLSLTEVLMTDSVTCLDEVTSKCLQTEPAASLDPLHTPPGHPEMDINKSPFRPKENPHSSNLFEVLLQVLSCYLSVQRQQANPNRVFTVVTNQLIQPLVLLRQMLTSGEFVISHTHLRLNQHMCGDIRIKIDSILQSALFPPEHLISYKEELLPSKEDSGKCGPGQAKGPLKPVSAILSRLSTEDYCELPLRYSVKSNTLSLLFNFFLESYRKRRGDSEEDLRMLCFCFLIRLVPALDLGVDGHSLSSVKADQPVSVSPGQRFPAASLCSPENWSLALLALESLLSQALLADIYNVATDRLVHQEVQLHFYRTLGQMLFNQAQPSIPAWYQCLTVLLSLNHLILEPDLGLLLSSAWVNSKCMEAEVQQSRQLMVCSLLQTYTKVRQLPRLFSELVSVTCQSSLDELQPPLLSEGVTASLRSCLLEAPPSQGLEICSLVLQSVRRYIMSNLVEDEREPEVMEIDGGGDDEKQKEEAKVDQKREDASLKLFSISHLLHAVLFSLKTLDNASPLPLIRQSRGLMEEMQQLVKELLQLLSAEKSIKTSKTGKKNLDHRESEKVSETTMGALWVQKIQEAALLLMYTWVEVDTCFDINCSKYKSHDSAHIRAASEAEDEDISNAAVLTHIEKILFGDISTAHLCPTPYCSPMSRLLLKLLTLQQMKKVLLCTTLLSESSDAVQLKRAAQFILAKCELEVPLDDEQMWDGQIGNVGANSYFVAHWHLVLTNLPLIAPYLNREDVDCIANVLVSSLLSRQTNGGKDKRPSCLSVSLISLQLLQSPILTELPSLFSGTVCSLTNRIKRCLVAAHPPSVGPMLLKLQEKRPGPSQSLLTQEDDKTLVEHILASSKTGEVFVVLTNTQNKELVNLLQVLTNLNPDAMSSDDLASIFLLLLFTLTSTSSQSEQVVVACPDSGSDAVLVLKLLKILTCLLEGKNFQSVLKLIHGGTLLQAAMSSLLWHSSNGRFGAKCCPDWLDVIKAMQGFITSLVQLIIIRKSSVRLNLDQFCSFLTSKEIRNKSRSKSDPGASILSVHLVLASLTAFAQAITSNLGRSKAMDQTLTQMLTRVTASLGPAVESVLKPQTLSEVVIQPASMLGQAFLVEVVRVMLRCELSSLSIEGEKKHTLNHMTLYQGFYRQILREINFTGRPMDFLLSSLHFLSAFYKAVERTRAEMESESGEKRGKELDELYMQILQNVHRLLTAPWLSPNDISKLESAVQELLCQLLEKSTTGRFSLLLLMIRQGLDRAKLRVGNYREELSAVTIIKLLSCCQLPEPCSKVLWLIAPQIISAMVFLVRSSSQDTSLTLPFTVPTVMAITSLLRQGEGLITNPHHVILVLGALQEVPLDHLSQIVYESAFLCVHETLFAIIQCYPQVTLKAAPSFLNVFYRLVASLMQEGQQRGVSNTGTDSDVYLQCARLIERMYSHIAATAESFTTLSAFMVAQYVTELQKVTLRPDVKLHLTEGIYQILDLCMEQDIKFLMARLQIGVREVFDELYSSYTHYHKAQRQGEDKYTV
ncbi:unhealthy ribosome biogenesis protein 2 homolog isoform X2 [Mastacembelus armatus]|uniref:URB2 ribosome biogenesis homolog n=3 Tax=Mastacembelus armatus TaxID=205130 RepID=A0A3Q3ST95_9TELE|nr:unhealthy ribosome biogenesis protein 2 homolog isoform X2 [Mastacembelus armatus]